MNIDRGNLSVNSVQELSDFMERNNRAYEYCRRVYKSRRDASRWWDTLVQRALACGVGVFVLALLVVLWVTR